MSIMPLDHLQKALRVQPATRYPADPRAVFVLSFAIIVGFPLLIARVAPGSIAEIMPLWGVVAWAWGLVIGCVVTLVGMASQKTVGIIVEQVGSVIVGVTTVIYGVSAALIGGGQAAVAAGIIVGFGCSCFYRWFQLRASLMTTQRVVDKIRKDGNSVEVIVQDILDAQGRGQTNKRGN